MKLYKGDKVTVRLNKFNRKGHDYAYLKKNRLSKKLGLVVDTGEQLKMKMTKMGSIPFWEQTVTLQYDFNDKKKVPLMFHCNATQVKLKEAAPRHPYTSIFK